MRQIGIHFNKYVRAGLLHTFYCTYPQRRTTLGAMVRLFSLDYPDITLWRAFRKLTNEINRTVTATVVNNTNGMRNLEKLALYCLKQGYDISSFIQSWRNDPDPRVVFTLQR